MCKNVNMKPACEFTLIMKTLNARLKMFIVAVTANQNLKTQTDKWGKKAFISGGK